MGVVLLVLVILFLAFQRRIEDWLRPFADWMHEYAFCSRFLCSICLIADVVSRGVSQHARRVAHTNRTHVRSVFPASEYETVQCPLREKVVRSPHLAIGPL